MSLEAQIESLQRQNRRLRLALFAMLATLFLFVTLFVAGSVMGSAAARNEQLRAAQMERLARQRLEASRAGQASEQAAPAADASTSEEPSRTANHETDN